MNRVITALVMLIFSVAGITVISIILEKQIIQTDIRLHYLCENIEKMNESEIKNKIKILNDEWKKTEKFLKFVSVHDKVDIISENISNLIETENSDKEEIKNRCIQIRIQIEMLYKSEKPIAENIF